MRQILCFGDSNTYGLVPKENRRYPWGVRWTSILNSKLGLDNARVIEEGLCGRTTVFDDPLRDHRNGSKLIRTILETNDTPDQIIIMLGTNDCKTVYGATAEIIGRGVRRIIRQVRDYTRESKILLVSPIHLGELVWKTEYDPEFSSDSIEVSKELAGVYRRIAREEDVEFLDASEVASPSDTDQEHLNEEGHRSLADAIYKAIAL